MTTQPSERFTDLLKEMTVSIPALQTAISEKDTEALLSLRAPYAKLRGEFHFKLLDRVELEEAEGVQEVLQQDKEINAALLEIAPSLNKILADRDAKREDQEKVAA